LHRRQWCAAQRRDAAAAGVNANASNEAISARPVQAIVLLNPAADMTELQSEKYASGVQNEADVRSSVPDSPQLLLKQLRFGLCLFTGRRPLS
jgi:hypothetical protein